MEDAVKYPRGKHPNSLAALKPRKPGVPPSPASGRPPSFARQIASIPRDAQARIYAVLHEAIRQPSKEAAAEIMRRADIGDYGFILELAEKELLGKNGWNVLRDILDRLFGYPKQTTENTHLVNEMPEGMTKKQARDFLAALNNGV